MLCSSQCIKEFPKERATVLIWRKLWKNQASQVVLEIKNLSSNAADIRDAGLIPGSGRSPAGGHGNPLQHSCLENPMDRGAWWASGHEVAKSQMTKSDLECTDTENSKVLPKCCKKRGRFLLLKMIFLNRETMKKKIKFKH